ncbi:hypothetical protein [Agrobacterium vitis]|uniref:hypothetical protein n=1 Tax=Agrobacterium vitis TaxID=373 RepID=UPI0015744234|nr:hypothetical protein [Agrobacterium vitis]NSZ17553.1 hypothetical protein [Agrobacterium vitis]QZO03247.1 hypothetical protein K4831_12465 [Agrobacterium vitis]UJL88367.1 hypothetical protein AVF2S5_10805 [Agrobacterium vitis]
MTEDELYEAMDLGFDVRTQPDSRPPNKVGHTAIFYVDVLNAAPGKPGGHHQSEYVQTYYYPDMTGLQIWQCEDGFFASRIGVSEELRWIGYDLGLDCMLHWRHIFTPQTADEIFNDLEKLRVDRECFSNELDWINHIASQADELVKMREANLRRQARKPEIMELA